MEGLGLDNILDNDEIASLLFTDETETNNQQEVDEEKENNEDTTEVDPESLFGDDDEPESVGSDKKDEEIKEQKGKEETSSKEDSGSSPDFFSSIATAFAEEGIFPDLDEETIKGIKDAESFRNAINEQIKAGLDEQQRRVVEALDAGVEVSQIKQYEHVLGWLEEQESNIAEESEAGEDLRRRIIYQDYINKGFKEDKAKQKVEKIFEDGSDVEEAKDSLQSLLQFYGNGYNELYKQAKAQEQAIIDDRNKKAEKIKKTILEGKVDMFGDLEISKDVRKVAYDAISKPIYKDPKSGNIYTAIQKLELENQEDFMTKLGLLYALTDGFTNIGNIVDKKVKKEMKKGFSELERKINNTARNSLGNLDFASGVNDENAFIRKGVKLDI